MSAEKLQHDRWSAVSASSYWQSVIFERTAAVLLGWTLLVRVAYVVALYGFGVEYSTLSSRNSGLMWLWCTGVALLFIAVGYRVVAARYFAKSAALSGEVLSDFMPFVSLRKRPMVASTRSGRIVDWDLN